MKKSFMNNIKHFVDSNVRQRIDRAANNNNDFFGDDLLLVERQFEDMRHVCVEAEKRLSALLQSLSSSPLGAYTQNVQASLNNLSTNLSTANSSTSLAAVTTTAPTPAASISHTSYNPNQANGSQFSSQHNKLSNQPSKFKSVSITNELSATITSTQATTTPTVAATGNRRSSSQLQNSNSGICDTTLIREDIRRHKKLPIVGFLKFLVKSCHKLRPDSLLATTLTQCSQLQTQLTKLYLSYEQTIELQCLKPIQHIIEIDVPNVIKLRKLFIKSHNDLESVKAKYNGASHKQQQLHTSHFTSTSYTITQNSVQQANINKLDQLKKELDESVTRFEQARAEYQKQIGIIIQNSLPPLSNMMADTPRKVVFGTPLDEHLRCTGRSVSLVIELCVHILYSRALNEEGLFRIPGSSVKIRKLKNAVNAWFVTLASRNELYSDQHGANSSVLAVHNLFKEIAGQRPQHFPINSDTIGSNQINPSTRDDSLSIQTNLSSNQHQCDLVFDVHTIAGLLKLYLRELPEPLFTHALYQQCLDATSKAINDHQLDALEDVIRKLPKANYDNLRHLIRFLHLLTCHRELNKMTATNLAITMAPSLIWACPTNHTHVPSDQQPHGSEQEDIHALNLHMSSVGISASLHALVIENLINNAEKLFPGPTQFSIPSFDDAPTDLCDKQIAIRDRCVESSSPTGLSTASSSSFSSSSNTSLRSSMNKKHSRKAGSMEGLLGNLGGKILDADRSSDTLRSFSVQSNEREFSHAQQPPPVPPAPVARNQMRNVGDSTSSTHRSVVSSNKSLVPLVPPTENSKRQQYISGSSNLGSQTSSTFSSLVQSALASSGPSLQITGSTSQHSSLRPSVPPPHRPQRTAADDRIDFRSHDYQARIHKADENDNSFQGDNKSSHSLASSENFRADFEEINAIDVDDISVPSVSPVVSLDDTVSGDDSSFDNDCQSLEHSWTDCDLESPSNPVGSGRSPENMSSKQNNQKGSVEEGHKFKSSMPEKQINMNLRRSTVTSSVLHDDTKDGSPTSPPPPIKPPRSLSPKVTQSTPL